MEKTSCIYIYKSKRLLARGDFSAHIQLGKNADCGAKLREGDMRTPEGEYEITTRSESAKFKLSMGISYPNPNDAARGLAEGIISRDEYDKICVSPHRPPWDTPMGGYIMIHAQPVSGTREGDWTAGCIALKDADMEYLYSVTRIGDKVVIV